MRRTSSYRAPHRGDTFSVDDAQDEINLSSAQKSAKYASGSARRQPSTVRRRPTVAPRLPTALETRESEETVTEGDDDQPRSAHPQEGDGEIGEGDNHEDTDDTKGDDEEEEDDADLSDAESFTLKDRQEAINETHPFGIRIWKPALYKKSRSVEKGAEGDIHSTPGEMVSRWLWFFNFVWSLVFGWWLATFAATGALLCHLFAFRDGGRDYGYVLWGLAGYIFYPFGKYVKLIQDDAYVEEDEGAGRSVTDYEQWQSGDLEDGRLFFGPIRSIVGHQRSDADSEDGENDPLIRRGQRAPSGDERGLTQKRRLFGRGDWNAGRIIYFVVFYGILTPLLSLVSLFCWLIVFAVPMARLSWLLLHHLRRRPLALEFHSDRTHTRANGAAPSAIVLCTYRAVGLKYWKYTIGGTNIILLNLLGIVVFTIFDYFVLHEALEIDFWLTNTIFVFLLALFSIIPLAYFIGQAVASISAQSTMGVGAAINAFFSTLVEVFLYCIALREGKSQLVEGSIVGSVFAGILLLPGLSMCFGAIKRKTQRFNVRSAGVTTTMLLFAVIGAFGPTLFYQIYGAHELNCEDCVDRHGDPLDRDCRRCFFAQIPAVNDPFYTQIVQPYCWLAAVALFLSYVIGLLFTLRTHAATIWNMELDEKKAEKMNEMAARAGMGQAVHKPSLEYGSTPRTAGFSGSSKTGDIRDSQLYKRILGQSMAQAGISTPKESQPSKTPSAPPSIYAKADGTLTEGHIAATDYGATDTDKTNTNINTTRPHQILQIEGLSSESSRLIMRQMAEMAATAATVAARDASASHAAARKPSTIAPQSKTSQTSAQPSAPLTRIETSSQPPTVPLESTGLPGTIEPPSSGGHDAPNWGRTKSYIVLLSATVAYAVIAEILVSTVDAVLSNVAIDQKFLGITLFALVPNTTEFLNAISFAMNGNIALSMEIGSAYALQVCLLQIPALVLFSALSLGLGWQDLTAREIENHAFTLIFPQWDMVTTILCVFLLAYMYGEGKSNYFKGSILILAYLVVVVGFWMAGFSSLDVLDPNDDGPWPGQESGSVLRVPGRGEGRVVWGS